MKLVLGLGNPGEGYRATRHNVGFRVVEELARRRQARLDRLECNALTARIELAGAEPVAGTGAASEPDAGSLAGAASGPIEALVAQPQTYMNRSGFAARCLLEAHGLAPAAVLVVYDEVNLPFGRLRLRRAGSPAGHRGIESILENLRTDQVPRLRVGIGLPGGTAAGEAAAGGTPAGSMMAPAGGPGDLGGGGAGDAGGGTAEAGGAGAGVGEAMVGWVLSPFTAAEEEVLAPVVARAADACEVWLREGIDAAMSRFNGGGAPAAAVAPETGEAGGAGA